MTDGAGAPDRVLLHEGIESGRGAREYQRHASTLGYEPLGAKEMQEHDEVFAALRRDFGKAFCTLYGWASGYCGLPAEPRFSEIEGVVNMDHLRPLYRWASHSTHSNAKGIADNIGLLAGTDLLLAGPSNAGLAEPGQMMCVSLMQVSASLLLSAEDPDMGDVAIVIYLMRLARRIGDAFLAAADALDRDHAHDTAVEFDT